MRYEEQCSCGGTLTVVYNATGFSSEDEREEGRKHIDAFRAAHGGCIEQRAHER